MRKVKAVAIAVLTVLAAMIVARTAAGDDSIQAIEPQQITTANWQQVKTEPAQQIIETETPEARVEEIIEPAYIPSTEAAEGCISEAELIAITEEVGAMYDICPELLQALVERWTHKGTKVELTGRLKTGHYTNRDGKEVYYTEVLVSSIGFGETKQEAEQRAGRERQAAADTDAGFMDIPDYAADELPFR